jgi:flagellar basal body-associated protein FliL
MDEKENEMDKKAAEEKFDAWARHFRIFRRIIYVLILVAILFGSVALSVTDPVNGNANGARWFAGGFVFMIVFAILCGAFYAHKDHKIHPQPKKPKPTKAEAAARGYETETFPVDATLPVRPATNMSGPKSSVKSKLWAVIVVVIAVAVVGGVIYAIGGMLTATDHHYTVTGTVEKIWYEHRYRSATDDWYVRVNGASTDFEITQYTASQLKVGKSYTFDVNQGYIYGSIPEGADAKLAP